MSDLTSWLEKLFPEWSKDKRFWWFIAICVCTYFAFFKSELFKPVRSSVVEFAKVEVPYFFRCDGFHGVKGSVIFPNGRADIPIISVYVSMKGAGNDDSCRHSLEIKETLSFEQKMPGCAEGQELVFTAVDETKKSNGGKDKKYIVSGDVKRYVCNENLEIRVLEVE